MRSVGSYFFGEGLAYFDSPRVKMKHVRRHAPGSRKFQSNVRHHAMKNFNTNYKKYLIRKSEL